MASHPKQDGVVILFKATSGMGGTIQVRPRDLDSSTELPTTHAIPASVLLGGVLDLSMATASSGDAPTNQAWLWVTAETQSAAYGMRVNPSSGAMQVVETLSTSAVSAPTSIDLDDRGRMYVVSAGRVGPYIAVFERSQTGGWMQISVPLLQGVVPGTGFVMHRSRENVDAALFQTSQWQNFPTEEYEWFGDEEPDCVGDLNNDQIVDGADLGTLLGQWNQDGTADFNGDDLVDGADLGTLLGAWGECPR
jgi:hypothetical protein